MLGKKLIKAAAGNAGGANPYIEDVFSTYLYTGNGSTQTISNGIALGDTNYGPAVEFDGVDDFLSRSTSLTGAVDSKTFTASFWVFRNPVGTSYLLAVQNFYLIDYTTTGIKVRGSNGSGFAILDFDIPQASLPLMRWSHVLVSINMASTSQRHVYVNDSPVSVTYTTYTNDLIDFTGTYLYVGNAAATTFRGRLSNVYLDTTYRDLTVEANRRIFITADDQPATGLASLNPIIYFPFDDTTPITTNLGTGGDYVINGAPKVLSIGGPYTESGYGQGGLVWIKGRSAADSWHNLWDTERGTSYYLNTNATNQQFLLSASGVTAFNSDGFSLTQFSGSTWFNDTSQTYASWTFRKAPKFFDVVTYTGTGSAQNISHNLGSVPGCIIVKDLVGSNRWCVFHRSTGATQIGYLERTNAFATDSTAWNNTDPTSTQFTVGSGAFPNFSGSDYIAYLFAHDAGGFGDDGEQNVISCGSYTGNGGTQSITVGFEPQWLLIKRTSGSDNWAIMDSMRNFIVSSSSDSSYLAPNLSSAEANVGRVHPNATGFGFISEANGVLNGSGDTYIYIAIRRGPMKTPESGTEVFEPAYANDPNTPPKFSAPFPVDMIFHFLPSGGSSTYPRNGSRLTGTNYLVTSSTAAAGTTSAYVWDYMNGFYNGTAVFAHMFRRAPGFMDVVCYTGNGTTQAISHNLGVTPELLILKARSSTSHWRAISSSLQKYSNLNLTGAFTDSGIQVVLGNNTSYVAPTSTQFTLGSDPNTTSTTYVAYLFATLAGVSKVGSYTGTGTTLQVDCGFSAGARFVLIKRTDSTGDWYVWDSARGIIAGNDPFILINSTAAENTSTDYIDPLASGFEISSTAPAAINASGGTFIFLAIA